MPKGLPDSVAYTMGRKLMRKGYYEEMPFSEFLQDMLWWMREYYRRAKMYLSIRAELRAERRHAQMVLADRKARYERALAKQAQKVL